MEYNVIDRKESCTPCLINVGDLLLEDGEVHEIAEYDGRLAVIPFGGDDNSSQARFIEPAKYNEMKSKIEDYNS
jgi:hypothetical protein